MYAECNKINANLTELLSEKSIQADLWPVLSNMGSYMQSITII